MGGSCARCVCVCMSDRPAIVAMQTVHATMDVSKASPWNKFHILIPRSPWLALRWGTETARLRRHRLPSDHVNLSLQEACARAGSGVSVCEEGAHLVGKRKARTVARLREARSGFLGTHKRGPRTCTCRNSWSWVHAPHAPHTSGFLGTYNRAVRPVQYPVPGTYLMLHLKEGVVRR